MLIFTKKIELLSHLAVLKNQGKTIGFIPTMGALHQGHLSLITEARSTCNISICSIFVNPTQFNDQADLARYPRTPENDIKLLISAKCDVLFMPEVAEMYDHEIKVKFDLGQLNQVLEAAHRPGHFDGVAQIVGLFFELIRPNKAFFGSKDFQQVLVVKALNSIKGYGIEVIACPIVREADGLAMSSRNALLSAEERKNAAAIPKMMHEAMVLLKSKSIIAVKEFIRLEADKIENAKLDYFEIADPSTLEKISELKPGAPAIALIAIFVGKIRLIDNLIIP